MRYHDLVLLHGQPGLGADWQQVIGRLPAEIRAVAPDRPGYGSSKEPPGSFEVNARAVLDDLDRRGIERAVLAGHSYGGGVALTLAALAPERVEALILLASVGPGCLNGWDRLLAAPVAGPVCALFAWQLTPWFARARLSRLARKRGSEFALQQYVNWYVWGYARWEHGPLWRTFLAEQRVIVRETEGLARLARSVRAPALLLADPADTLVPIDTARRLEQQLPDARLSLVEGAGHHLPLRAPAAVAEAIVTFLGALDAGTASSHA
ncbi:MAG TPA: alpha/beta hydrolase [Streptosporangiaceae bacterium]|nr:alpha/beta hydrolase [Streptosporangiaceae bacterium]